MREALLALCPADCEGRLGDGQCDPTWKAGPAGPASLNMFACLAARLAETVEATVSLICCALAGRVLEGESTKGSG